MDVYIRYTYVILTKSAIGVICYRKHHKTRSKSSYGIYIEVSERTMN